jgi:hypothetical protein
MFELLHMARTGAVCPRAFGLPRGYLLELGRRAR